MKLKRFDECPHGLNGMIPVDNGDYIKTEDVSKMLDLIYRHFTDGNENKVLTLLDEGIRSTEEC